MTYINHTKRPAFSIITALFIILLMASVAAFIMNLSGKMVKGTSSQYQKEQAILYAKSYTEYAIMSATARNCINRITAFIGNAQQNVNEGEGYNVRVDVQYIGNELSDPSCNTIGNLISHAPSKGSIMLVDTYVRYRDLDTVDAFLRTGGVVNANNLPWITYHRRTIQRL